MARRLAAEVYAHRRDDSGAVVETVLLGPDSDLPSWATDAITNPAAWQDDDGEAGDGPPPQSGRGSGLQAWQDYAAAQQVDVPEDATREQIITALADADVPVE